MDSSSENLPKKPSSGNRRTVVGCLLALGVMGGITAVSPELYSMFCQVTGYGGTTQRAAQNASKVLDRTITVRFDGNVSKKLAWKFEPDVKTMEVKIGETNLAFFRATNLTDKPLSGQAAFNVAPESMGPYFQKIECFCFTEQTLAPHQTVEMPITFFIDPKMVEDSDTKQFSTVTLSYVFYPLEHAAEAPQAATSAPKTGGG
ncbi:cytochrome c oxidase assembly protein [Hyphomicrobium methylovorum]|uniref:cytochrome c oxidase assembly protein n=1 Tax=Hyphomicrobium methylovorum TaxID=84 RepID=UPI0015E6E566|nr:cytochrome c oxidase assembly protein [Hyphomicrobium methylovorum]MBA2125835.1 cytochrome c oxidase assembly protein [Hyphomicrobium methylovorum]